MRLDYTQKKLLFYYVQKEYTTNLINNMEKNYRNIYKTKEAYNLQIN